MLDAMHPADAHALVIGVSDGYQHLPRLTRAQPQELAAALADPRAGGYLPANVRLLVEEQASRARILAELDELAERAGSGSSVLLYFSGHGGRGRETAEERYRHYLMPVDARNQTMAELEATAISGGELAARLAAISAPRLTVILDCCRAAAILEEVRLPPRPPGGAAGPVAGGRGRVVLSSSGGDEYSYVPRPGARNSVFTEALLRGLRGAVQRRAGALRVCDLYRFVRREVTAQSPLQHPALRGELEANYPIARWSGRRAVKEAPARRTG